MRRWFLDYAATRKNHFIEEPDGSITIDTVQDVGPIIEDNKRAYNAYGDKLTTGKRGNFHHAARVPTTVYERWMRETNGEIQRDPQLLKKYLNDPANKFLRTAPTRL